MSATYMSAEPPIEKHPRFRRLAEYLAEKAGRGKLPGRQHIDPAEITDLLPYLVLMDVIPQADGEPRYRIRLMGGEVAAIQGSDATGKFIDDVLTASEGAEVVRRYAEILRSGEPQYRRGVIASTGREHVHYERVAFPLARDGRNVDMLLFVFAAVRHGS
jgi:hypothetical protein